MQIKAVFCTSGWSRSVKIGKACIHLRHAASLKLQHAGTKVGLALCALFYLGKKGVNNTVITSIKTKMTPSEFKQLTESEVPAWMKVALRQAA
jgi:hypothetical protein